MMIYYTWVKMVYIDIWVIFCILEMRDVLYAMYAKVC